MSHIFSWWIRIRCKQHETMDLSCHVSTVQGTECNGVSDMFLENFWPLVPIEHYLNPSLYDHSVPIF